MTFDYKNKSSKNIIKNIGKGLFAALVLFILFYIILTLVAPRKIIKILKYQNFVITSGSMDPTLKYGDIVIVKDVNPDDLKNEDIITFYADVNIDGKKEVVTHYIAQINENNDGTIFIRTHRENSTVFDSWLVQEQDVIGVKVGRIKYLGKIILYIQSGFGLGILLADVIIIYLIVQILNNFDEDNNSKNKNLLKKHRDEDFM